MKSFNQQNELKYQTPQDVKAKYLRTNHLILYHIKKKSNGVNCVLA